MEFSIKLLTLDDGIQAIFSDLNTKISYEGKQTQIHIPEFDRIWKTKKDPLDTDDIGHINTKNMTIDLAPVIRQEIIMAFHNENL